MSVARLIRCEAAGPEGSRSLNSRGLGRGSCSFSSGDNGWRLLPDKLLRGELRSMAKPLLSDLGCTARNVSRFSLGGRGGVRRRRTGSS